MSLRKNKAGNKQSSTLIAHKVGFKEPVVSYNEQYIPRPSSKEGAGSALSSSAHQAWNNDATTPTLQTFCRSDYDAHRVLVHDSQDHSHLTSMLDGGLASHLTCRDSATVKTNSPNEAEDQALHVNELNAYAQLKPSYKPEKLPRKIISGVAHTTVYGGLNDFPLNKSSMNAVAGGQENVIDFSQSPAVPCKTYNFLKKKRKLAENPEALARLKETIRKQKENRSPTSNPLQTGQKDNSSFHTSAVTRYNSEKPVLRKIAHGPPAPEYKGFSAIEATLRTPDGKVWKEDRSSLKIQPAKYDKKQKVKTNDSASKSSASKHASDKTNKDAKTKVTRKIGKIEQTSASHKASIITPSSWREGQMTAKAVLGLLQGQKKDASGVVPAVTSQPEKDILSVEMKSIVDDLQLPAADQPESKEDEQEEGGVASEDKNPPPPPKRKPRKHFSKPPLPEKRVSEPVMKKVRHYDQSQVQQYMAKQRADRRRQQVEQKRQKMEADQRKMEKLNSLDQRQREARKKVLSTAAAGSVIKKDARTTDDTFLQEGNKLSPISSPHKDFERRYDAFGKGILSSTNPEDFSKLSVKSKDPKVSAFVSKLDQFLSQNNIDSRSSRQLSSSQGSSRSEERDSIADGTSYDRGAAVNLAEPHTSPRQDVALSCANNDSIQAKVDRIAALKAKSELLQKRLEMQTRFVMENPLSSALPSYLHAGQPPSSTTSSRPDRGQPASDSTPARPVEDPAQRYSHNDSFLNKSSAPDHSSPRSASDTSRSDSYHSLLRSESTASGSVADDSALASRMDSSRPHRPFERKDPPESKELGVTHFFQELKQRLDADSVHPRKSNRDHARGTTSFSDSKRLMTDPRSKSPQPYRAISGDKYSVPNIFTRKYMKYVQKQSGRDEPNGKEPWRHDKLPAATIHPPTVSDLMHGAAGSAPLHSAPAQPQGSLDLNEHDLALNLSNSSSSESTPRNPAPQRATPRKEADPDTDFLLRDDATPRNDVVTDPVAPRYEPASALTIGTSENIDKSVQAEMIASDESPDGQSARKTAIPAPLDLSSTDESLPSVPNPAPAQPVRAPPPALDRASLRFSPAVLEHKLTLELNRCETLDEAMRQLTGTETCHSVALAQQETVSLAQVLQSRQLQHQLEMERLASEAKVEALEASRRLHQLETDNAVAQSKVHERFNEKLIEMASSRQGRQSENERVPMRSGREDRSAATSTYSTSSDPYSSSLRSSPKVSPRFEKKDETSAAKKAVDAKSSSFTESSSKRVGQPVQPSKKPGKAGSDDRSSSSKSVSEDIQAESSHLDDSDSRSITEDLSGSPATSSISERIPGRRAHARSAESVTDTSDLASVTFDASCTEDEMAEISRKAIMPSESHRRHQRKKPSTPKHAVKDSDAESVNFSVSSDETLPSQHKKDSPLSASAGGPTSLFGDSDIGSFSQFLNATVRQYMIEQEMRAKHQAVMLKLREKAVREKAQAELAWLEQQKHTWKKGEDDKMPPLKKKKRAIMMRWKVEIDEIKKLQAANKAASQDRELILQQHKDIKRIMKSTKQIKEKIRSTSSAVGKGDVERDQNLRGDAETSDPSPPSPHLSDTTDLSENNSDVELNLSSTNKLLRHLKLVTGSLVDRKLTIREEGLLKRRKDAERLIEWKRKLDEEEKKVLDIEKQALAAWGEAGGKNDVHLHATTKKGATNKQSPERKSPASLSESSVPEEASQLPAENATSPPSSIQEDSKLAGLLGLPSDGAPDEDPSDANDSSKTKSKDKSAKTRPKDYRGTRKPSKPNTASTSPTSTTPLLAPDKGLAANRGRRKELSESWSDESFSQTQSETEQSDIECRVHALKEELKRRRLVADRLKKQQKKKHKEHLRAQEASLKSQIEAYDSLIKKTQHELTQELEPSATAAGSNGASLVHIAKPQIRSPRKSDHGRQSSRSLRSAIPVASPEASPRAGSQKPKIVSGASKQRLDSDSSGRSSRSLSFEDDLPWSDDAPVGKAPALALSSQAPSRSEKSAGSASDSSPITPQALSPSTEFPSKLEVGGSKPNNTASVSPPSSAMGDKPVQRSLIPVPTKTPSQSRKDDFREVTAADVTATDVKRDVGIFESKQDASPTTPSSSYTEDFEHSSIGTDDEVSEHLSEGSTDKSDVAFKVLDLTAEPAARLQEIATTDDDDEEKTPVASPSTTPTPSAPHTPTPEQPSSSRIPEVTESLAPSYEDGVDVTDGTRQSFSHDMGSALCESPAGKRLDVASPEKPHDLLVSSRNNRLADRLSEQLLAKLVEDSLTSSLAIASSTSRDHDPDMEEPSAEASAVKPSVDSDEMSDGLTRDMLMDTIGKVLQIRKERMKKLSEEMERGGDEKSEQRDAENEVENILQEKRRLLAQHVREGRRAGEEGEPVMARPVSPIFGSSQDDGDDAWFDDELYPSSFGGKKTDKPFDSGPIDLWKEELEFMKKPLVVSVPHEPEEIVGIIDKVIERFYEEEIDRRDGDVEEKISDNETLAEESYNIFEKCLTNLVRELMQTICGSKESESSSAPPSPWSRPKRVKRPAFSRNIPKSKKDFRHTMRNEISKAIKEYVLQLIKQSESPKKLDARTVLKWGSMKKKDNVDLLLIEELCDEEPEWTDYDADELTVKMQLTDSVFDLLLNDTVQCFEDIEQRRAAAL